MTLNPKVFNSRREFLTRTTGLALLSLLEMPSMDARASDRKSDLVCIKNEFGINVHFGLNSNDSLTKLNKKKTFLHDGSQAPDDGIDGSITALKNFLSVYGTDLVKQNLSDLYLFGTFLCGDKQSAGTYDENNRSIFMATQCKLASGELTLHDEVFLEETLHHEFSSILMYRYKFPFNKWLAISGGEKAYKGNAFELLDDENVLTGSVDLYEQGFLAAYGAADYENDFNTYAETTFMNYDYLCALCERFPKVKSKFNVLKNFYFSLGVTNWPDPQPVDLNQYEVFSSNKF